MAFRFRTLGAKVAHLDRFHLKLKAKIRENTSRMDKIRAEATKNHISHDDIDYGEDIRRSVLLAQAGLRLYKKQINQALHELNAVRI